MKLFAVAAIVNGKLHLETCHASSVAEAVGLAYMRFEKEGIVEAIETCRTEGDETINQDYVDLIKMHKKIGAIKLYRERTGANLKTAKDFIFDLAEKIGY